MNSTELNLGTKKANSSCFSACLHSFAHVLGVNRCRIVASLTLGDEVPCSHQFIFLVFRESSQERKPGPQKSKQRSPHVTEILAYTNDYPPSFELTEIGEWHSDLGKLLS
jgi:hypothetical protein